MKRKGGKRPGAGRKRKTVPIINRAAEEAKLAQPLAFDIKQIERFAAVLDDEKIAEILGMSTATFRELRGRDPLISSAYKKGRAQAVLDVGEKVLDKAKAGDLTAAIFFLKTRGGWRERSTFSVFSYDPRDLTDEQLERIASGEDPERVLTHEQRKPRSRDLPR